MISRHLNTWNSDTCPQKKSYHCQLTKLTSQNWENCDSLKNFVDTSGELGAGTADCALKMPLESAQLRIYYLLYIVSAMFRHKFANSRLQMHHNILPQLPRSESNCECFNHPPNITKGENIIFLRNIRKTKTLNVKEQNLWQPGFSIWHPNNSEMLWRSPTHLWKVMENATHNIVDVLKNIINMGKYAFIWVTEFR